MKLAICCLFFVVQATLASPEWNSFKTTHQKVYKNVAEEVYRKQIFLKNLHLIEEHNKKYDQGLTTYKLGVNKLADLTEKERLHISKPGTNYEWAKIQPKVKLSANVDVPDSIDWRDYGVITPITDQSFCNSCWAFAVVGTVEAHNGIYRGQKNVTLSQQNLVECVDPTFDCYQPMPRDMLDRTYQYIIDNHGLDTYSGYPYEYPLESCHYDRQNVGATFDEYGSIPDGDEEELKRVVGTIGPVTVAITTQFDWDLYVSGVYYNADCMDTTEIFNHAVIVIGYGTENGQDYWLVKNSWGIWFGQEGYIKMARNRDNNCGIASIARYPIM